MFVVGSVKLLQGQDMTSDIFIGGIMILSLVAVIIVMMTSSTHKINQSQRKIYDNRKMGPVHDHRKQ